MRSFLTRALAVLLVTAAAWPRLAAADPAVNDKVAAEALYDEAKKLLNEEKWQAALDELLASQRLDPAIGTLLNIGYCYERLGKTASAWASYNEVVGMANAAGDKQGRGDRAAQAAKALEAKLARVVVAVPKEGRADKLEVRRDGDVIDPGTWDTAIPTDPGPHDYEASAPGRALWRSSVVVAPGPSATTVSVPVLSPAAPAALAATGWGAQRTAGVAVAGVGVAGVIAGSVFGGLTIAKKSAETSHCQKADPHLCDANGVDLRSQALTMANASNVAFVVGGAALVTGAVLFFTAPKSGGGGAASVWVSPVVGTQGAGVRVTGRW